MKKTLLLLFIFFFAKSFPASQTKIDSVIAKLDSINAKTQNQIEKIKKENDSLVKRLDQIEKNDYKSVEVIEKVNDFYDKSWNKLMYFLGFAGSIALLLIPYLQTKNQEKQIQAKTDELENKIKKFHNDQFELLRNEINLSQEELNKNIKKETEYVQALIFVLRGMLSLRDEDYEWCIKQYIIAINLFIGVNSNSSIERMIKELTEAITECTTKGTKIKEDTKSKVDKLIVNLEKDYWEIFPEITDKLKTESLKLTII